MIAACKILVNGDTTFVETLFNGLFSTYGPQHWWPADSVEEMMVGAILVQNTNWNQASKVIARLKNENCLSMPILRHLNDTVLWDLLKPSGYFRIKSQRLKALAHFMGEYDDQPQTLFKLETQTLRKALLNVHGIGKETADSILCYGAKRAVFVVDTYCKRLFSRLGWIQESATYDQIQQLVHNHFPHSAQQLGELHALIVTHSKKQCQKQPLCTNCPLLDNPNSNPS